MYSVILYIFYILSLRSGTVVACVLMWEKLKVHVILFYVIFFYFFEFAKVLF